MDRVGSKFKTNSNKEARNDLTVEMNKISCDSPSTTPSTTPQQGTGIYDKVNTNSNGPTIRPRSLIDEITKLVRDTYNHAGNAVSATAKGVGKAAEATVEGTKTAVNGTITGAALGVRAADNGVNAVANGISSVIGTTGRAVGGVKNDVNYATDVTKKDLANLAGQTEIKVDLSTENVKQTVDQTSKTTISTKDKGEKVVNDAVKKGYIRRIAGGIANGISKAISKGVETTKKGVDIGKDSVGVIVDGTKGDLTQASETTHENIERKFGLAR